MKRVTTLGVVVCVLVLSWLPSHRGSAGAAVSGARTGVKQVLQAKTIEHQISPDGPATRLQVVQLAAGEFEFQVEYPRRNKLSRATGEGKFSKDTLFVRFKGPKAKKDVTFLAENGALGTTITLSNGRLSFRLVIDEYIRARMSELKQMASRGVPEAELKAIAREVDDQLEISEGYRPFIEQVKSSPAFEVVEAVRSLASAVSGGEIDGNSALAGVLLAAKYLTPHSFAGPKVSQSRTPVKVQPITVSYNAAARMRPQMSCNDCTSFWFNCCVPFCAATGIIFGENWETICQTACFVDWLWCIV